MYLNFHPSFANPLNKYESIVSQKEWTKCILKKEFREMHSICSKIATKTPKRRQSFQPEVCLTHSFTAHPFLPPENIRKPKGFLMFSGGRERVHW